MVASPTLLLYADLAQKGIKYSKTQLWRLEKAGAFPKRVRLSAARHGWVESEINAWIIGRIEARAA